MPSWHLSSGPTCTAVVSALLAWTDEPIMRTPRLYGRHDLSYPRAGYVATERVQMGYVPYIANLLLVE